MTNIQQLYEKQRILKKWARIFFSIFSILEITVCVVAGFVIRYNSPELTETQLFIRYIGWWIVDAAIILKDVWVLRMVSE